ncbi:MAG: hypothetical protein ABSA92_00775 [Candidatus Bathyarchaeia archaeon]
MISKQLIIPLISILLLMTNSTNQVSPSQVSTGVTTVVSSSTLTSYSTYSVGVTQVTSTVTNTIYNGNIPLMGWGATGCLSAGFPFNANPGDQLTVKFVSNIPIDFYVMSAGQFQRVPSATSQCSAFGSIPVFPSLKAASYQTSYSLNWTPPLPGQFFIVLLNLQPATASVMLSASITSVQVGSVMVNATATTTITNAYSQVSSTLVTVESTTAAAEGLPSQTIEWVAVVLILVALGVIFLFSKKRTAKVG